VDAKASRIPQRSKERMAVINNPYTYAIGYGDPRSLLGADMQNAARAYCKLPPPFPRSEATQDTIMIRRVNARIGLAYDKKIRHYKHIGIGLVAAFVLPWLVAIFIRSWGFCMAWIAS
jgi:hypothetical protein